MRTPFGLVARARRARAMHPRGVALAGEWSAVGGSPLAELFGQRVDVRARMSKSVGLPGKWPDVLGLAVRLPLERPVDLLFSTVGVLRLPFPRADWGTGRYDTIMPYRTGNGLLWLTARVRHTAPSSLTALRRLAGDGLRIEVGVRGLLGPAAPAAVLSLRPTPAEVEWFDPVRNSHPELPPAPRALARLRKRAYADSRRGREVAGKPETVDR